VRRGIGQTATGVVALVLILGVVGLPFLVGPLFQRAPVAGSEAPSSPTPQLSPSATGAPSGATAAPPEESVTLIAAGDIADCHVSGDERTAELVEPLEGTVAALGDLAYPHGTAEEYANCYDPSWGRFKDRTRPVPGSHDYDTEGASAYFDYFGDAAGERGKGYYSYDLGAWHIVALNSNCREFEDGCGADSAQARWLAEDLAANPGRCILAYTFSPRFSSGSHGSDERLQPLVKILYDARASVLLSAHDHHYERFRPLHPEGYADDARGIRQFVVGTGGRSLRPVSEVHPASEVNSSRAYGVLRLTLSRDEYEWEFLSADEGEFRDSGRGRCR
jgi:acid phosphatase type 7